MRIGKSRLNLTAGIRLSKNIFFGDGISGGLAGSGIFGTTSQALAISPQFAQGAATFGTTSAAQLPYLAQGANTFGADHSATASSATFLLDDYPGAAAAYSVRLLSSTYSGPLVRIRKETGGNPEKDFYPDSNNELSLNSGDGGGTTLGSWIGMNSGYVVSWYDQSGNSGRDATNATASEQPQIVSSGSLITENGKAAIDYDGNDELVLNATLNTSFSGFAVAANDQLTNGDILRGGSNAFLAGSATPGGGTPWRFRSDVNNLDYANQDLNQHLHTWINNTSTSYAAIDGATFATVADTSINQTSVHIGGRSTVTGYNWEGNIQEIVMYASNKLSDRTGIETNINDFFTIY